MQNFHNRLHHRGPLYKKSFDLSVRIVNFYKHLTNKKSEYVMSKQILRSGTSTGALVRESNNAESSKDFIHKLAIAQKEISETQYWLELLYVTDYISEPEFQSIYADTEEIMKLIRSSIITKKKKMKLSDEL